MSAGYVAGRHCTYHAPAGMPETPDCCTRCGGELVWVTADQWNARMRTAEQASPGYSQMIAWSEGRCFPDLDTMQNAYRQAMEGEELPPANLDQRWAGGDR